jgi:hypothetical protein
MRDIEIPRAPMRLVVDDPLVAIWTYGERTILEHACRFSAKGGRGNRATEFVLQQRFPGCEAIVVSSSNRGIADLAVEAVTDRGELVRHQVPFLPLSTLVKPLAVAIEPADVVMSGATPLLVKFSNCWFDPTIIQLHATREATIGSGLRHFKIRMDTPIRLPDGTYEIESDLDCLDKKYTVQLNSATGAQDLELNVRLDFALCELRVVARSGRQCMVEARVTKDGRRVLHCGIESETPKFCAFGEGSYSIQFRGLGVATTTQRFNVGQVDYGRRVTVNLTVDDL